MRKYPEENWKRLGEWLHDARMEWPEYRDVETFARVVGRSTRQIRGLERGESVGPKTLEAYSKAIGITSWFVFAKLADPDLSPLGLPESRVRELKEAHVRDGGTPEPPGDVWGATEADLLDLLGDRISALKDRIRQLEAQLLERGGIDAGNAEAQKIVGPGDDWPNAAREGNAPKSDD